VSRLRGVGARLSLALLVVVAGALGVVYAVVVPSLEERLVDSRVSSLERSARRLAAEFPPDRFLWPEYVERASASTDARVLIYIVVGPPPTLLVVGDSRGVSSEDVQSDRIALRAATAHAPASGTATHGGKRLAEAAVPIDREGAVLLLSSSLEDAFDTVGLVRTRLLIAGGIALVAALVLGYGGAWLFARRLRRLEQAAERIASGRFDEPVADAGGDEVGQLARAFDRMRERLAALDRARSEFIANASHELRTPLFSLGGFIELLRDEELDEGTRREFLGTMGEQVERLTKLAGELLDLSRLDAGRLALAREQLDLAELAEVLVEEFAALARAGERPLELEPNGPAPAIGDPQRVLQIGRILVENALVHTPPRTRVRVAAERSDSSSLLRIEDTGAGVAPEHAPHVFERFYRGAGSRASGSGLGLAIARELARLMDGTVELESEPGRTAFTLELPATVVVSEDNGRVSGE
jgi:signal transduction histidine kinase